MGPAEVFALILEPTVGVFGVVTTFLAYEYSRPEIAYYRLVGSGAVTDQCVRFFVTSFERIAVTEPFAVVLHLHSKEKLKDRVRRVDVKAGPWHSSFVPLAEDVGLQVHFGGMPAGGVFLVEVHPTPGSSLEHSLGFDAVGRIDPGEKDNEGLFKSRRVRVSPRGFRSLDPSFRGPFTRFYVQVVIGLIFGLGSYALLVNLSHRVFPSLPASVDPAWVEGLLLLPILLMSIMYYVPRRTTSANDGVGREFACAYRKCDSWPTRDDQRIVNRGVPV